MVGASLGQRLAALARPARSGRRLAASAVEKSSSGQLAGPVQQPGERGGLLVVGVVEGDLVVPAVVAQQLHAGAVADHVGGGAGGGGPYLGGVLGGPAQREREVGQRVPEGVSHDTHADMIV